MRLPTLIDVSAHPLARAIAETVRPVTTNTDFNRRLGMGIRR
jgi:cation transport ATPase